MKALLKAAKSAVIQFNRCGFQCGLVYQWVAYDSLQIKEREETLLWRPAASKRKTNYALPWTTIT